MLNLKKNRADLVNYLYQYDLVGNLDSMLLTDDLETQEILQSIILDLDNIDDIITENLFNYQIERLGYLDRAIIRLATYELKNTELNTATIINEAVKMTKQYSDLEDERQHKFTNKLLDNISKFLRG
ncbi:MAG TPA: transcription antitermination factor NusB [Haploplasma sp.]|nr:transcription antitermination factor NusB [Haploplasma sp.]